VLCPRSTHCAANKKKNFSLPLFGVYLIFFVFLNNFGNLEKELKNAMLQRKNECRKHTSSRCKDKTDVQSKDIQKNSSWGQRCKMQRQSAIGLAYKACFRWFS
jgi:hypothetical protein